MRYIIIAILLVMSSGCARPGEKDVLARVDGKDTITLAGFNERISELPEQYQDVINKNKKEFLDEVIIETLLYNEAVKKKLDADGDVKKLIKEAEKKILIARLLNKEIEEKIIVNENDISAYYNANKEKFATPETLRASHILVKTEEEAEDVLVELSNNRNFEDLARSRSIDTTSKIGGDIGYFTQHQLVPEIEEVCFDMQAGEISGIVKTQFGYHVVKLTERKPPRVKELAEVRDAIEDALKRIRKKALFSKFITSLKEKAQITINNNLLETISAEPEQKPEA
ncbi:MAG: peptidyl-prolyl cis-trans isomerase [Candidatus Omnitrophota bacterium]|nr:MAG: peptidyl-prolyl cis-trans isomerase [Candidatus Omnitrophota bacterium]